MNKKHVIIGLSAVGISAINRLRMLAPNDQIVCITDQPERPYNKCFLADVVSGVKAYDQLFMNIADNPQLTIRYATRAVLINTDQRYVQLESGEQEAFDTLCIATGASAWVPLVPGKDLAGVFTFHTLGDMDRMLEYIDRNAVSRVGIIGSGLTGLECADALASRGLSCTIIERSDRVLPHLLAPEDAELIHAQLARHNVALYRSSTLASIEGNQGKVSTIVLSSGECIELDMVIFATGTRPNGHLAVQAGIATRSGAIITNDYLQTSVPGIWAGGDVALVKDQLSPELTLSCTWPDAMLQGIFIAQGMAGTSKPYPGVAQIATSAFFGLSFAATRIPQDARVTREISVSGLKTIARTQGILTGFTLIGDNSELPALKRLLLTRQPY